MFSLAVFFKNIDKFVVNKKKEVALGLAMFGEEFINDSRDGGNYQDHTSNLRGSIAYDVYLGGESFTSNYDGVDGSGSEAKTNARTAVVEAILQEGYDDKDKITLVGVAGMEYAAAVESKHYDVITPFIPEEYEINAFLKEAGLLRL